MFARKVMAVIFILSAPGACAIARNDSFVLSADRISASYTPTYIGNGNIGVSSSQLGTAPTHSYMAWIYEHYPGDVARIASLPAWNGVDYFDGVNWLNDIRAVAKSVSSYRQTLDMYNGTLNTRYSLNDGRRRSDIEVATFVSRSNPNLAVVRFDAVTHSSGEIKLRFPIAAWGEPDRMYLANDSNIAVKTVSGRPDVWYPGHTTIESLAARIGNRDAAVQVLARPDGDTTSVAIVAEVSWSDNVVSPEITADTAAGNPEIRIAFRAKPGVKYSFFKFVGIVSSRESGSPLRDAKTVASSAMRAGYKKTLSDHEDAWHKLWRTDITVTGNPGLQKVIHSSIFYLLCSARAGSDFGVPPMGLSSDGYYGHIFWDSDTWMFPPLLLMHPAIARSMVMFRYRALPAAEANAALNHYQGAMYPWESDENGSEACPRFAYQNALWENHVTGDVAFAQWQYFLATADTAWLVKYGFPVISKTADFWVSRSTYDSSVGKYNINHVVSVDEGLIGVNNDAYTNLVAIRNLQIAGSAARLVGKPANPKWEQVADRLYIPFDSSRHCYLTYENAPAQSLGAVVPLLYYPLELQVPNEVKANDLRNALAFTKRTGGGVMMGITLYQNVAAEIQNRRLFDDFFSLSYKPYIRGAFNVFAETPQNMSTLFLTGAGGFLQQVLFGYTGLRITAQGLVPIYKPMLPPGVKRLKITGMHFRGRTYDVAVHDGHTTIRKK